MPQELKTQQKILLIQQVTFKLACLRYLKKGLEKTVMQWTHDASEADMYEQVLEDQKRTLKKVKHEGDSMIFDLQVKRAHARTFTGALTLILDLTLAMSSAPRIYFSAIFQVELDAQDEIMSIVNLEMIALKQAFRAYDNEDGTRQVRLPRPLL